MRSSSLDLPGRLGQDAGGEILLRTDGPGLRGGGEFEHIVLWTHAHRRHGRAAARDRHVIDGFEDSSSSARFNGLPVRGVVDVKLIGDEDILDIAGAVKNGSAPSRSLPRASTVTIFNDESIGPGGAPRRAHPERAQRPRSWCCWS